MSKIILINKNPKDPFVTSELNSTMGLLKSDGIEFEIIESTSLSKYSKDLIIIFTDKLDTSLSDFLQKNLSKNIVVRCVNIKDNSSLSTIKAISEYSNYIFFDNVSLEIKARVLPVYNGIYLPTLGNTKISFLTKEIVERKLLNFVKILCKDCRIPQITIKGHITGIYSLAKINRELAESLDKTGRYDVLLELDESNDKFELDSTKLSYLNDYQKYLFNKTVVLKASELEIRNLWPIKTENYVGRYKAVYFAWEESRVPLSIINKFNENLDIIFVISEHVKKALVDSGISIPVKNILNGIDTDCPTYNIFEHPDEITFLHISSGLARKGIEEMIMAYTKAFTKSDNVKLLIKTYWNERNVIKDTVTKFTSENSPKIEVVESDLSKSQMEELFSNSQAYVSASRAEGYNIPLAESMIRKLPVITTGWGGQMDFCNEENSLLVKFKLEKTKTNPANPESEWAVADIDDLKDKFIQLKKDIETNSENLQSRIQNAYKEVIKFSSWDHTVELFNSDFMSLKPIKKIGVLTTWNIKCGIFNYSKDFVESIKDESIQTIVLANTTSCPIFKDEPNVVRCWDNINVTDKQFDEAYEVIMANNIDSLLVQYNPAYISIRSMYKLFDKLYSKGIKISIVFHATDEFKNWLKLNRFDEKTVKNSKDILHRVFYHNEKDRENLNGYYNEQTLVRIEHGIKFFSELKEEEINTIRDKMGLKGKFVISTHGFLYPHKGHDLLIEAVGMLKSEGNNDIKLMLVSGFHNNLETSKSYWNECKMLIEKYHLQEDVLLIDNFLDQSEIYKLLSLSDLIVFPYQNTTDSASGAVRNALKTSVPILVSDEPIFEDVKDLVFKYKMTSPEMLKGIILEFMSNKRGLRVNRNAYINKYKWDNISKFVIDSI
ncbi:MAG: glycosyltransferase [bacterium]